MRRNIALIGVLISLGPGLDAKAWDTELRDLNLVGWSCLLKPSGTAHGAPEAERNLSKNRLSSTNANATNLDVRSFLELVHDIDRQLGFRNRSQLTADEKAKISELESKVVTLTGWLVWFYPGPAESTNCGDSYYHDWHLELLEQPLGHAPAVGDPTAVICEITPRTEAALYRVGVRLQNLAAYVRLEDNRAQPTGHAPHRTRVTGFLMWDDAHNNKVEVGPAITGTDALGLGHPWRRTAWEVHPIWELVDLGTKP